MFEWIIKYKAKEEINLSYYYYYYIEGKNLFSSSFKTCYKIMLFLFINKKKTVYLFIIILLLFISQLKQYN